MKDETIEVVARALALRYAVKHTIAAKNYVDANWQSHKKDAGAAIEAYQQTDEYRALVESMGHSDGCAAYVCACCVADAPRHSFWPDQCNCPRGKLLAMLGETK